MCGGIIITPSHLTPAKARSLLADLADELMQGTDPRTLTEHFLAALGLAMGAAAGWVHGRRSSSSFSLLATWQVPKQLAADTMAALTWSPCVCQRNFGRDLLPQGRRMEGCERLEQGAGKSSGLRWHLTGTLVSLGRPVGLLSLAFTSERVLTALEAETVRRTCALLGSVLNDSIILAPPSGRRTDRVEAMSNFASRLLTLDEPSDIASALLEPLATILPADFLAVYTPDEDQRILSLGVGRQWPEAMSDLAYENAADVISTAARGKDALLLPSLAASPWPVPASLTKAGAHTLLVVPIRMLNQLVGVLAVAARPPVRYGSAEVRLVRMAAEQTALAMAGAYARARTLHQVAMLTDLHAESERRQEALWSGYTATLAALGDALGLRDPGTMGHSDRAVRIAVALGKRMGLGREDLLHLEWGAHLHDIGKIGVPDAILSKPGPLTAEERQIMQAHPTLGYRMLSHLDFLGKGLDVVRCHHERYDGTGYPEGLAAEAIPLLARIFSVADSFDAMTSVRPYRKPFTHLEAQEELIREQGRQFDPAVVEAFRLLSEPELIAAAPADQAGAPMALPQPESVQQHILTTLEPGALTEALFTMGQAAMGLQELLDFVLRTLEDLFATELGSVLLLDGLHQELYVASERGYSRHVIGDLRMATQGQRGVCAWVARNARPYYVPNVLSDPIYLMGNPEVRSELALPLIVDGTVIGVLNIESRKPDAFPAPVRSMLEVFSGLVSLICYRQRRQDELEHLALTDPVSGLANRHAFMDQLDRQTAQSVRGHRSYSVLLFQLEQLSRLTEMFGQVSVDQLLAEAGATVRARCRRGDFPARLNADTLAVIASGARQRSAESLSVRLKTAIGRGQCASDFGISVATSTATFPKDGKQAQVVLHHAVAALSAVGAPHPATEVHQGPTGA
ncbi:MAG: HD domain-containing phosphohydrolase [Sulfobacillus sp.]